MARLSSVLLLVLVTSQICSAVILRPSWFPYFRRPNQTAQRLRYSDKVPEVFDLRQTRDAGTFNVNEDKAGQPEEDNSATTEMGDNSENPCKSGISVVGCLIRVLNIVNHAMERQGFTTE